MKRIDDYVDFDCNGYMSCGRILSISENVKGRKIYLIEDYLDGSQIELLEIYIKEES